MADLGKELAVSPAGLEEAENEPFRVATSPLELRRPVAHLEGEPAPDWVMVGVPVEGGGVRLLASLTLTRAELEQKIDGFDLIPISSNPKSAVARVPRRIVTITAVMRDFTQILAEDYPSALRSLLEMWSRARPQS